MKLQEQITTSCDVDSLRVKDIRRLQRGRIIVHRIDIAQE